MGLVQAQLAFYHDSIGTKALNEIFEVKNEQLCAELEQAGYVKKVDGEQAQAHQEQAQRQQEYGQAGQQANEAISQANHLHNQEANRQAQQAQQIRQQLKQQGQNTSAQVDSQAKATPKKANENK
jgi:hypothetical protein